VEEAQHLRTLAFTSYGLFWLSLVVMLVLPKMGWPRPGQGISGRLPAAVG